MSVYLQTKHYLQQLQAVMQELDLWQSMPPAAEALQSTQPFALDTLSPAEWLQWIFIPRMLALIECEGGLPVRIAVSPYLEEALKDIEELPRLLSPLLELEKLLQEQG